MSTPTPTPDPDADKKKDVLRRLDALRAPADVPAAPSNPDALPNLLAQKVLVILSQLNANQVQSAAAGITRDRTVLEALAGIKSQMTSEESLNTHVILLRGELSKVGEQCVQLQAQLEVVAFRVLAGAITLAVMLLGLAAIVAVLLGRLR